MIELHSPIPVSRNVSDNGIISSMDDGSVVLTSNVNESATEMFSNDTVTVEAIPSPSYQGPDRGPIMDFFQNFLPATANPTTPEEISLDPPDDCDKCSCVLFQLYTYFYQFHNFSGISIICYNTRQENIYIPYSKMSNSA